MSILKPDQRLLTVLKRTRDATVRELSIKAKVHQSKIYGIFKQLEEQGRVKHCYLEGDNGKFIKHYKLTKKKG